MNYDALLARGLDCIPPVREFSELFPNAEHTVVKAKRDIDGWQFVYEWISRNPMDERYVVWLVVAINIRPDGSFAALERPSIYVVEINKIERSRDHQEGPSWEFEMAEFEDGDWEQIVASRGDFAAIGP